MIESIFNLLTTPPGNLIYHLVLTFTAFGALISLWSHGQAVSGPSTRRLVFGFSAVITAQLVLFGISALTWQGLLRPENIVPPLDAAITVFTLLWVAWMWVFPKRIPLVEAGQVFANILSAVFLALSLVLWGNMAGAAAFTQTWIADAWELIGLIIVLTGGLLLVLRRPSLWGTGLAYMLIVATGFLAQLFTNQITHDFSGPIRLGLLAAFPLLLALPQRSLADEGVLTRKPNFNPHPVTQERRRYSTDSKTLEAFLQLACQTSVPNLPAAVCRVIGHAMLADLTFLVTAPESSGIINLEGGYDLIREEAVPGSTLSQNRAPQILASLQKGRPLYLYQENSPSIDLDTLAVTLGLNKPGNLLLVPFFDGESRPFGGMLLLSPYANRVWTVDDQIYLQPVGRSLVRILQRLHGSANLQSQLDRALIDLDTAQAAYQQIRQSYQELHDQLETLKTVDRGFISQQDNLESVIAIQQEYQGIIAHLQSENEILHKELAGKTEGYAIPERDPNPATNPMISGGFIQDLDPVQTTPTGPTMEPTVAQPLNPADLNGIIDATIGSLSESLAQKSLNLETDFPEELPLLSVERDTIARIVFDLVEHAIETSPSGSSIHMEVKLRKQDGAEGNLLFTITHPYPEIAGSSPGGSSPFESQPSNPPDQATLITRLGLSELKALVETFHGGFRADILPEGNAALNLLLPIQAEEKPSAGLDE